MKVDAQSFSPSSKKNHYKRPSSSIIVGSETKDSPSLIFSKKKAFDSSQKCKVFYYPDLVRVFHYNLKFRGNIGYTKVKGVEIILDDDIWTNVARIPPSADRTSILSTHIDGFNRILTYQSLLRQPDLHISKKLLAGPLTIEARLLHCLTV